MRNSNLIKQQTERNTADPVMTAVRRQQQIHLARQVPLMMSIGMVITVFVAGFLSTFVELVPLLVWLSVTLLLSTYSLITMRRLQKRPAPETVTGRTLRRSEFWSAGFGVLWAVPLIAFQVDEPASIQFFLAVVMVGLASGFVSMLQIIPRLCGWFAGTIIAALIVHFVLMADVLFLSVAGMALIFFLAAMSSSQRAYRQLVNLVESSLELERAKLDLVDGIESIRDAFAIWAEDGSLKLANERFKAWFADCSRLSDLPGTSGLHSIPGGVWLQGYVRPMTGGGHVSVHTDVTALRARERELIAARLQAEEANAAKSHFLANMSHELRTPLNAIMGFAEMISKGVLGPHGTEKYRQYADDIHGSAAQLLAKIEDILNLSRMQTADYELNLEKIDISAIVNGVLDACARQEEAFDREQIDVWIDPDLGPIRADPKAFRQVLLNLVRNAVKFTPPQGRVAIEATVDERGQPRISVSDTGIGISREKLGSVRQPFGRAEGPFERKFRGTGVGLSISDALVRLHGGDLELESELGKGTRVVIVLPAELRLAGRPAARAS